MTGPNEHRPEAEPSTEPRARLSLLHLFNFWRRDPLLTLAVLVILGGLLAWGGYQGLGYYRARLHGRAAQEAAGRHAWAEAQEHLEAAERTRPHGPAMHLLAARVARRLEKFDLALEHLDACQRLQGDQTQAVKVERALLRVHGGDLAGAEEFLRRCVAQDDPDTVEILDILSAALILNYRVAEAIDCLDDLLRREPDHFHALVRRGWAARSAGPGYYDQAVKFYTRALDLRPEVDNVRLALAEMLVAVGRFADAQKHFEELRDKQPDNPGVLFGVARCLAGQGPGQHEKARQLLDRLLAAYPDNWQFLAERGRLDLEVGRPAEAEGYLRRAVARAPPDVALLNRFAQCLRLLDKKAEAREYQTRAEQLKADLTQADRLGTQIREKSPNDPDLRYQLACTLLELGKHADALHWFKTALEKAPEHRPTHQALVEFYEKAGDFAQAARHRQALR